MSIDPEANGRHAAEEFRAEHRLGDQPLGDLITIIEQTVGVDIAVLDVHAAEHGMTMRDPRFGTTIIAVAKTPHPMRQRSTLAHELAHVLFEDAGTPASTTVDGSAPNDVEERATAFARHLLIPQQGLTQMLSADMPFGEADLSRIVQRFLVSPQLALVALRQRRIVIPGNAEAWERIRTPDLATKYGWMDQYRQLQADSDSPRAPQLLLSRATRGYQAGVLGAGAIARLRGVTVDAIEQEFREAGVVPDRLESSDDPLPMVTLNDDELDELLGNGPEPAS